MDLYEIFSHSNSIQGGSTERLARELAMMQMQREAADHEREQRLTEAAHQRMQRESLNDPALVRMRQALEAPVEPFQPERPGSYAPGAASDVGTLRGAFSSPPQGGGGGGGENMRADPASRVNVSMGDLTLSPSGGDGAFDSPIPYAPEPREYGTTVHGERNRKPLPASPRRMPGGIDPTKGRDLRQPGQRPDLSPEGAAMYEKLAPSLVNRRNAEESSRRGMEVEQMRGDTSKRNAQLRSATDLLRTGMMMAQKAEQFRLNRKNAKSKDEALKWADQERDARLQAMNAKMSIVEKYQTMFTDENDPEFMAAKRDAHESMQLYQQAEQDFNALRSERGMDPKSKGLKKGGTQTFSLDANGQLVPG